MNGRNFIANLKGNLPETKFIGKILKLKPEVVVKYIKGISSPGDMVFKIGRYFEIKKSIIRNLFKTDNLFVSILKKELTGRHTLKTRLKEGIHRSSIQSILRLKGIDKDFFEFIVLQKIYHFINDDVVPLFIPLRINGKKSLIRGTILKDEEDGFSVFVIIHFEEDEDKAGLLLQMDFASISCTIFTDDGRLYQKLHLEKKQLENSLRSVKYNRTINVNIKDNFGDMDGIVRNIKKIDLKM